MQLGGSPRAGPDIARPTAPGRGGGPGVLDSSAGRSMRRRQCSDTALPGPTSVTNCIWPSRHEMSAGQRGSTRSPCPTRCPVSSHPSRSRRPGTHRGKAIVADLIAANEAGEPLEDVVWDPGYSLCTPGTVHHKLAQAGIHQTFQPVTHQRGIRPFSGEALLIDGQLFSSLLPDELGDLPSPPRGANEAERERNERSSTCGPGGG